MPLVPGFRAIGAPPARLPTLVNLRAACIDEPCARSCSITLCWHACGSMKTPSPRSCPVACSSGVYVTLRLLSQRSIKLLRAVPRALLLTGSAGVRPIFCIHCIYDAAALGANAGGCRPASAAPPGEASASRPVQWSPDARSKSCVR